MIEVKNLKYFLENKKIINQVSLSIEKGQWCGLLGPNGAGKSTLLKIISGLLDYDGHCQLESKEIKAWSSQELARKMAFFPQFPERPVGLSVRDYLHFSRFPYMSVFRSLDIHEEKELERLLEKMKLKVFYNRRLESLSGGEWFRVVLTGCLFQGPEVLILDEPFSTMDPHVIQETIFLLKSWQKESQGTVLMTNHDLNSSLASCDKIIGLKNGNVLGEGSPKELAQTSFFDQLYDVSFSKLQSERGHWLVLEGEQ
jgi:iron complex transport system ATP-binding protein